MLHMVFVGIVSEPNGVILEVIIGHVFGVGKVYHRTRCSGLHLKARTFVYIFQLHIQVLGVGIWIHGLLNGYFGPQHLVTFAV